MSAVPHLLCKKTLPRLRELMPGLDPVSLAKVQCEFVTELSKGLCVHVRRTWPEGPNGTLKVIIHSYPNKLGPGGLL